MRHLERDLFVPLLRAVACLSAVAPMIDSFPTSPISNHAIFCNIRHQMSATEQMASQLQL